MKSRPLRRWIAALLFLSLCPGAVEALENAGHLLVEGHLAHAVENGDRHADPGPEHGCAGTFHVCGCHSTVNFLFAAKPRFLPQPTSAGATSAMHAEPPQVGFHQLPDRPPRR